VLEDVERVGQREAGRQRPGVEVVHRRRARAAQAPAQVARARVGEVGELDAQAGLEQRQAVRADPAADVEHARARGHRGEHRVEVGRLRAVIAKAVRL
jgi:hypothetical protein